jgi:hypothetical protein
MNMQAPSAVPQATHATGRLQTAAARWWAQSRTLTLGGAVLLLSMLPTWVLSLLHPQSFNGIDAYVKPLKFQLSLGLYLLCLAWLRTCLSERGRQHWMAVFTSAVPTVAAFGEMLYILWRAAQGEGSHFNVASAAASMAYALMGIGALLLVFASGVLAWLLRRHAVADLNAAWLASLRWGLWLTMILGGVVGMVLSSQPSHWIGGVGSDAAGLPLTGWSRTGGDLRVAHFLGIHAMQILPLLGWWFARRQPVPQALHSVRTAAAIYTALTLATFAQALAGVPLLFGL